MTKPVDLPAIVRISRHRLASTPQQPPATHGGRVSRFASFNHGVPRAREISEMLLSVALAAQFLFIAGVPKVVGHNSTLFIDMLYPRGSSTEPWYSQSAPHVMGSIFSNLRWSRGTTTLGIRGVAVRSSHSRTIVGVPSIQIMSLMALPLIPSEVRIYMTLAMPNSSSMGIWQLKTWVGFICRCFTPIWVHKPCGNAQSVASMAFVFFEGICALVGSGRQTTRLAGLPPSRTGQIKATKPAPLDCGSEINPRERCA